jgi:hypothetical protein
VQAPVPAADADIVAVSRDQDIRLRHRQRPGHGEQQHGRTSQRSGVPNNPSKMIPALAAVSGPVRMPPLLRGNATFANPFQDSKTATLWVGSG